MNNKIIIINGPNLNLLGEREQSQYGSVTFDKLKENCINKSKELNLEVELAQSNVEGELVNIIQKSRKDFDGIIINGPNLNLLGEREQSQYGSITFEE
jgi:3-dehydroquinate dehydratase-2